jgi:hypothetical protein
VPTLRVTERIRRVNHERLEDEMTFISAEALTRPWVVTIPYKRVTTLDRMIHGDALKSGRPLSCYQFVTAKRRS